MSKSATMSRKSNAFDDSTRNLNLPKIIAHVMVGQKPTDGSIIMVQLPSVYGKYILLIWGKNGKPRTRLFIDFSRSLL